MYIRLFPNRTYVQDHILPVSVLGNNTFTIPLIADQIDINSIRTDVDLHISTHSLSTIYKGDNMYTGDIVSITDDIAIIDMGDKRITIRGYDNVIDNKSIQGMMYDGYVVPDTINMSYVTTGIESSIIHSLDMNTKVLETDILISNDTMNDLDNVSIDIVTSDSNDMQLRTYSANASMSESSIGTIYSIDDRYTLLQGYTTTVDIIDTTVDVQPMYIVDAPNGKANAVYTIRWKSPIDIPAGSLYIYNDGVLEGISYIPNTGSNQIRDTTISSIASIYAIGTIYNDEDKGIISLNGTIYNTMSITTNIVLRYYVGDDYRGSSMRRDGPYIIMPLSLNGRSSTPYDITITK